MASILKCRQTRKMSIHVWVLFFDKKSRRILQCNFARFCYAFYSAHPWVNNETLKWFFLYRPYSYILFYGLLHLIIRMRNKKYTTDQNKNNVFQGYRTEVKAYLQCIRCGSFASMCMRYILLVCYETCVSCYECSVDTKKSSYNGQYFI